MWGSENIIARRKKVEKFSQTTNDLLKNLDLNLVISSEYNEYSVRATVKHILPERTKYTT